MAPWVLCLALCGAARAADDWASLRDMPGFTRPVDGQDVYVNTTLGRLMGRRRAGDERAGGVTSIVDWFVGIPFALPPVGPRRFKKPEPARPWRGTQNATRYGWVCPQPPVYAFASLRRQREDCLNLNVYSPVEQTANDDDSSRRYPVMVFFHGGSNVYGSGVIYYGHLLAQHGVVVVTANYRLGMLGFMCAQEEGLRGNYGLWDQVETLRWVQRHISRFRGDPEQVTIFGNSAGGGDVGILSVAPPAKGLFKYAISQSGSPLSFWCMHAPGVNLTRHAREVLALYRCGGGGRDDSSLAAMVDCMRQHDWRLLNEQPDELEPLSPTGDDFKPCVDGELLPARPEVLLKTSTINPVAYMTGTTSEEWTRNMGWFLRRLFIEQPWLDSLFTDGLARSTFKLAIEHVVTVKFGWPAALADLLIQQYSTWEKIDDPLENRDQYVHFFTDMSMLAPTEKLAEYLASRDIPVYLYVFTHHSVHSRHPSWWKSYHTSELNYLFGSPFTGLNVDNSDSQPYTDDDRRVSAVLMTLWTDFAKFGHVLPESANLTQSWTPYTSKELGEHLLIGTNSSSMVTWHRRDKVELWNQVIPRLHASMIDCPEAAATTDPEPGWKAAVWVLLAVSLVLLITVLCCAVAVVKLRRRAPFPTQAAVRV